MKTKSKTKVKKKNSKKERIKTESKKKNDIHKLFVKNTKKFYQTDEGIALIKGWAMDGLSIQQMADKAGISYYTFYNLVAENEELIKAYNKGKEVVNYEVENAVLRAALGYKSKEVEITTEVKGGAVVGITKKEIKKDIAPSISAAIFWLTNKEPNKWKKDRSKEEIEISSGEDNKVQISIIKADNKFDNDEEYDVNEKVSVRQESGDE